MELLFKTADYSLHHLSRVRQWGFPGEKYIPISPIMQTVNKKLTKRGILSTLYDPSKNTSPFSRKIN